MPILPGGRGSEQDGSVDDMLYICHNLDDAIASVTGIRRCNVVELKVSIMNLKYLNNV